MAAQTLVQFMKIEENCSKLVTFVTSK